MTTLTAQVLKDGPEGDCGFSQFGARHITHFVDKGAVTKVEPFYPVAAKKRGLPGTARVRVLINKQGLVERTCPVYAVGEPKPERSFMTSAEAAALQWIFKPSFGLGPGDNIKFEYAQDVILFNFVLPKTESKDE